MQYCILLYFLKVLFLNGERLNADNLKFLMFKISDVVLILLHNFSMEYFTIA